MDGLEIQPTTITFNLATPFTALHVDGWKVVDTTVGACLFETSFATDTTEFVKTLEGLHYRAGDTHLALMVEELWTFGVSTAEQMLADNFPIIKVE